jgi:N-acetylated-alpha-linked acidic dipeptidase
MRRVGDPGFRYHAAMARVWGLLALRLANADVLPFDYGAYGRDIVTYLDDVAALARAHGLDAGLERARRAALAMSRLAVPAPTGDADRDAARSRTLIQAERDLLAPEGIPDRPWFRHLVYAPLPSYEAETLPGVREAILAGDGARAHAQAARLADALERAGRTLGAATP